MGKERSREALLPLILLEEEVITPTAFEDETAPTCFPDTLFCTTMRLKLRHGAGTISPLRSQYHNELIPLPLEFLLHFGPTFQGTNEPHEFLAGVPRITQLPPP